MVEEEQTIKAEVPMIISEDLNAKMHYLCNNFNKEIGGWIIGDVTEEGIYLEDLLLPQQEVTGGTVDIDPASGPALLKEFKDKCKRIIGHWHSHVHMGTFWSGTDETNMDQIMEPRKFFVFVVSSSKNEKHLIRLGSKDPFKITIDNLDYEVESKSFEKIKAKLEKEIEKKVTTPTPAVNSTVVYHQPNGRSNRRFNDYNPLQVNKQSSTPYSGYNYTDREEEEEDESTIVTNVLEIKDVVGDFEMQLADGIIATYFIKNLTIMGLDPTFSNKLAEEFSIFKPTVTPGSGLTDDIISFKIKKKKARKVIEKAMELIDYYYGEEYARDQCNEIASPTSIYDTLHGYTG